VAETLTASGGPKEAGSATPWRIWAPVLGFALMAIPTLITLMRGDWTKETGAHGPIVAAIGAWLIWRKLQGVSPTTERTSIGITLLLAAGLPLYVFGAAYDYVTLQCAGLFFAGVALLYSRYGLKTRGTLAFPLLVLALAAPAPHALIDMATQPLKQLVSGAATSVLSGLGMPVAREGATIFVAQYQLLVEDACSGLNSLQGLITVGLLYAYLTHGSSVLHSTLLTVLTAPVAIVANVVRVALITVTTYFFGEQASEGVFHVGAGLVLFSIALLLILAADRGLRLVLPKGKR